MLASSGNIDGGRGGGAGRRRRRRDPLRDDARLQRGADGRDHPPPHAEPSRGPRRDRRGRRIHRRHVGHPVLDRPGGLADPPPPARDEPGKGRRAPPGHRATDGSVRPRPGRRPGVRPGGLSGAPPAAAQRTRGCRQRRARVQRAHRVQLLVRQGQPVADDRGQHPLQLLYHGPAQRLQGAEDGPVAKAQPAELRLRGRDGDRRQGRQARLPLPRGPHHVHHPVARRGEEDPGSRRPANRAHPRGGQVRKEAANVRRAGAPVPRAPAAAARGATPAPHETAAE